MGFETVERSRIAVRGLERVKRAPRNFQRREILGSEEYVGLRMVARPLLDSAWYYVSGL